jgi:hypothetical protein
VEVVTAATGVHRHGEDSAPSGPIWCHRLFYLESKENRLGHCLGTAVPSVVHRPIFLESRVFRGVA